MAPRSRMSRRQFGIRGLQVFGVTLLAGCDSLSSRDWITGLLGRAEELTRAVQRAITPRRALAREFTEAERSAVFPGNGTVNPSEPEYQALARAGFAGYRLAVGGLVERPSSFSLAELRGLPSRTQITRHDCVEGWSAIAKWKGTRLSSLLDRVGVKPNARYVMFYCFDALREGGDQYYESLDLEDAYHEQTILAYDMNDQTLPVTNGAPLRLRVERQLGYKAAKYVHRIELVERFDTIGQGKGGYWEDRGYEWYAGI
jgi:DMSO/TMAO reductase YedYZ molybdopterin-dependent catalytic subunit